MSDFIRMVGEILVFTLVMLAMFFGAIAIVGFEFAMNDTSGKTLGLAMSLILFWVVGVWQITEGR